MYTIFCDIVITAGCIQIWKWTFRGILYLYDNYVAKTNYNKIKPLD